MRRPTECPKCQGSMTEGYILDETHGGRKVTGWIEGAPEKSMWLGLKTGGRQQFDIVTWRCSRCGYLENYAPG